MQAALLPTIAGLVGLFAPFMISAPASAAPDGMQGSYVGVTIDPERMDESLQTFVEMGSSDWIVEAAMRQQEIGTAPAPTATTAPTQFQGRVDLPNSAVSLRRSVVVDEQIRAVMPTLSYDVPVSNSANMYAGAGYTFVRTPGEATPLGDRNGAVVTTGVEAAVGDRFVVYGDRADGFKPQPNQQQCTSCATSGGHWTSVLI